MSLTEAELAAAQLAADQLVFDSDVRAAKRAMGRARVAFAQGQYRLCLEALATAQGEIEGRGGDVAKKWQAVDFTSETIELLKQSAKQFLESQGI